MKRSISFAFFFLLLTGAAAAAAAAEWRRKPLRLTKKRSGGGSGGESKKSVAASGSGASSFTASVFNLVNNVAGAGILALSAGQAKGTGWIPSIGICGLLGIISARTFAMIGEACELTGEEDFKVRKRDKICLEKDDSY